MRPIKSVAERVAERQTRMVTLAQIEAAVRSATTLDALRQELLRLVAFVKSQQADGL